MLVSLDLLDCLLEGNGRLTARLGEIVGPDRLQLFQLFEHGLVLCDIQEHPDAIARFIDQEPFRSAFHVHF